MTRSLRVHQHCLNKVKLALRRNGFPNQRSLSEDVGFALATVNKFLTGKRVDYAIFEELCRKLDLDWKEIADLKFEISYQTREKNPQKPQLPELMYTDENTLSCYPNGAVPLGSPFYVERAPQEEVYQEIKTPGTLVWIKAPREMGKTSMLLRILDSVEHLGYLTVSLNLEQVDLGILSDLNQFLRWLCANVARQLHLTPNLDEYWDDDLGRKISCTSYIQGYILKEISTPLVIAFDEVNQIFENYQVAKDFFSLLRSWYEQAKTLPIWQKLRLIVVYSTDMYVPLHVNQSPFNVGLPIQLTDFTLDEVQKLAQRYELNWEDTEEARQLMNIVGGHPGLVHKALYHLSRGEVTLTQLLESAPKAIGIYNYHLQRHWLALQEQPELSNAFNVVVSASDPVPLEPIIAYKLSGLGLIKQLGHKAIPSCELYRQFFKNSKI